MWLGVAAWWSGCGGAMPEGAPEVAPEPVASTPVTVALNWFPEPEFGGLYDAHVAGLYEAAGLDVTLQAGGAGSPVVQQVATGRVQFGVSAADEVLLSRSQGADIVAIFGTFQTHPACIMVHAARGLTGLEELTSGTLAVEDGIPFAQWLWKKYSFEGVTRVPYGGGVTQFLLDPNYAQQGYVTSEPVLARSQGAEPQVFMVSDTGYNPYANVLVTSGKMIAEHPEQVRAFVQASKAGWTGYLSDPTRANARIHELNPALGPDVLVSMGQAQEPLIAGGYAATAGLGAMERDRWTRLGEQLVEVGALQGAAPAVDAAFTNDFL
jgi:NitT/TauT family transport system substrate-binding protein